MITADELDRLKVLFEGLTWPIKDAGGKTSELFTIFVALLGELNADGRRLLLTITQDFLRHTLDLYECSTVKLVDKLVASTIPDGATVVLLPLVDPQYGGEIKSHGMASYIVKKELNSRAATHGWIVRDWERVELIAQEFPHRHNAYVLLIDDFVGSGETAEAAWTHFMTNYAVQSDKVHIVCLVAQRVGVQHMTQVGIPCITVYERWKGITDSAYLADKTAAMALMDDIESELAIEANKRRGYQKSEALVMMYSCPDNTFPVYWARWLRSGKQWPRPFRRDE